MHPNRRDVLSAGAALLAAAGLAGCNGSTGTESAAGTDRSTESTPGRSDTETSPGTAAEATVETAVAAEWNAMRARLWDAVALGVAGDASSGAAVAKRTFERFEGATGEYGAHEVLERTSESTYAEFEEALGQLRVRLGAGDVGRAREEAAIADSQLAAAQERLAGRPTARVFDLQLLGAVAGNAAFLGAAGRLDAAGTVARRVRSRFEESPVHGVLEAADSEAYEAFEGGLDAVVSAAGNGDAGGVRTGARSAFDAAVRGSYALTDAEAVAGTGHLATLQARGWDAASLAGMGGPPTAFAHAAALTVYRARAYDCRWLAARGETGAAATMAGDIFTHFERARAHDALETAAPQAYENFESGLSALRSAVERGDGAGIDEAIATVDGSLASGIESLAGGNAPLLEAALFRARLADARERYRLGESAVAASVAEGLFRRFERNELGFHEAMEATGEELYARFEEEHLTGLADAFAAGDDAAVGTHYAGAQSALLEFETRVGSAATVSGAEGAYVAARGFDAAVLDTLGEDGRAAAVARDAFEHFESGAGGYHESLKAADESLYETFETRLGALATAASDGDDVYPVAKRFNAAALDSVYAIVASAGGSHGDAAVGVLQDAFAHFEEARVHGMLEDADHNAYETFESHLKDYITALREGKDVTRAAGAFARASQYAQFALVDSVEEVPLDLDLAGTGGGTGGGGGSNLQGGPNVVDGVPEDADHVVDMRAVAYDPSDLTVSKGDTVAWTHAAGEAHTVTAYASRIPGDAEYWASGGFGSEQAARNGWENGKGAVQSGQSFVHTFETTGTHEYFCVPHEAAGMVGSVTVE